MFQSASIPNSQLCISAKIFLASLRVKSSSSFFCLGYTPRLSCCFEMQCHLCTEKKNCLLHLHFWNAFFFFSLKCWQLQSQLAAWFGTSHVFADLAPLFAFLAVRVMSRRSVLHSQSCSWRQLSVAALAPLALGFAGGLAVDEPDFYGALPRLPAQDGPSSASPSSVELKGVWREKKKKQKKQITLGKQRWIEPGHFLKLLFFLFSFPSPLTLLLLSLFDWGQRLHLILFHVHAVLAGKLQSDPYQAPLTASLPGLGMEHIKPVPVAVSDIVPLHIKQASSSTQPLNILLGQLFVQVGINHSDVLGKRMQEGAGAWPKLPFKFF